MSKNQNSLIHPSGDFLLNSLSSLDGVLGLFVKSFPGVENVEISAQWLKNWFSSRIEHYLSDLSQAAEEVVVEEDELEELFNIEDSHVKTPVRLISIQPHYFRGFRDLNDPINMTGDLIVIDGRNSSGKTSLTEALEWLFTGELVRRKIQSQGAPKELENCISNQLKPDGEETWVEARFKRENKTDLTLRRILINDYGSTLTSKPESSLSLNDETLSKEQEFEMMEDFYAGVPPLLMQHTLRMFVLSSPADRRVYFERLLRLDEIAHLIEKAVIGKVGLSEFPSPTGSISLKKWELLKSSCHNNASKAALRKVEKDREDTIRDSLQNSLKQVAIFEFSDLVSSELSIEKIVEIIAEEQREEREATLPILGSLRPTRKIDEELLDKFSVSALEEHLQEAKASHSRLSIATDAVKHVESAQLIIVEAFNQLLEAGLIPETDDSQFCPLCNYQEIPTLSPERITEINSWLPLQKAAAAAEAESRSKTLAVRNAITNIVAERSSLIPIPPSDEKWSNSLKGIPESVVEPANEFRDHHSKAWEALTTFDDSTKELLILLPKEGLSLELLEKIEILFPNLTSSLDGVITTAREYLANFTELDSAIGTLTGEDPLYSLRNMWLEISSNQASVISDLRWEQAKKAAQQELKYIRDFMIKVRQEFLNKRRIDFSDGMTEVWEKLRADRYSVFRNLNIPEPSGKGFPVEIEVKATLDDGNQIVEVDALRVFSESQVNVLGIAAFITRSKLLGHRTLIFDDPVQSMDEDHFKTFASRLIPFLKDLGFRVILLTHNDIFAREVSFACCDMENYVTMKIRHSRKIGCKVDEGNRRVSERLRNAVRKCDEGNFDEAWIVVRKAIERLYIVVNIKYGPSEFKPLSWSDQSTEYMWQSGVENIFQTKMPTMCTRLKEILNMTVVGAHDKASFGETDLVLAIQDIKKILKKLKLGSG